MMEFMLGQPQLHLMPNLHLTANERSSFDFKALKPSLMSAINEKPRVSWGSLLIVIALHVGILMFLLYIQKQDHIELPAVTPMMVSLLDSPQPLNQPAVEIKQVETPKPEHVKQKQVIETKPQQAVINTPSAVQPVQDKSDAIKQEAAVAETKTSTSAEPHAVESKPVEAVDKTPPKEDVVEQPKFGVAYLNNPAPNYPGMSRRTGEQGQVMLRVLVSATGEAASVELEKTSQYERLDQAAIEAVKKWRFVPAKKNNQPFSAYVLVPVRFSLDK